MTHTVLVVEDEEDLRETMREALELNGYQVVVARDGQEALEEIAAIEHICVVLLDLVMPRLNGWEFFEKIQTMAALENVPVIIHSSSPTQAPPGAKRVLAKPLRFDQLLSVVREFCAE